MWKRPDVIERNKSEKQILAVSNIHKFCFRNDAYKKISESMRWKKNWKWNKWRKNSKKSCENISKWHIWIFAWEKHPNRKWWVTKENTRLRNSEQYRLCKNECFIRDNFTCKKCNKRWWTLNAHHIENFSNNISLRYNINNVITLCKQCHNEFHKRYKK